MADNKLANAVVRSLSEYLTHRNSSAVFDARLENLLSQVEAKLAGPYTEEMISLFKEKPAGKVETDTLQLHLSHAIAEDPEFGWRLAETYGGQMAKPPRRGKWLVGAAAALVVAALVGAFVVGRTTAASTEAQPAPTTVTSTVEHTVTETVTNPSSSAAPPSSSGPASPVVPGDGGTLPEGTRVFLTELPRPNDEWQFGHGDHDVQFTQYNNSLWQTLHMCKSSAQSREQQFRLKNFSRIEVKAIGTDSEADPGLFIRFEVFVNNDNVNPIASVVVNPGETKELKADLPAGVFVLTLRMSLHQKDSTCQRGNAVWGSPYVVAASS